MSNIHFNVSELKRSKYLIKHQLFVHFEKVLNECIMKIKNTARDTDREYCTFIIPRCSIGDPTYNIDVLEQYIIKQLTNKDIFVVIERPRLLYISWKDKDIDYVKQQRLMEERRERLQSDIDYFNQEYDEQYQQTERLKSITSDKQKIIQQEPTQLNIDDIREPQPRRSRSHKPKKLHSVNKHKPTQVSSTPTNTTTNKSKKKKNDEKPVVTMSIMYHDGMYDTIPVDKDIYDIILEHQDGFDM